MSISKDIATIRELRAQVAALEADAKRNRDLYTLAGVKAQERINQLSGYLVKEEERVIELEAQVKRYGEALVRLGEEKRFDAAWVLIDGKPRCDILKELAARIALAQTTVEGE